MRRHARGWHIWLGWLALALPWSLAQAGMATPGQFAVSASGAATYTLPIQVPPGTAGLEPQLALSYNSQGGNGLLGMGWSLSGLSAIGRCPRTMAQDNVRGAVNYDNNDRYCLDGQRLMAVSGADGADGTTYRTELDSFAKVVSYGGAGAGPAWFRVWTKSGQVMEYGATADARIEAQGKATVRVWALNRVQDTKGNYLTVSYVEDNANGDYYPQRIDYSGNANTNTSTYNSVQFTYEDRPDVSLFFQAGSATQFTKRLVHIRSYMGASAAVKDYELNYELSNVTKRSRISRIMEHADSGQSYPPIVHHWSDVSVGSYTVPSLLVTNYGQTNVAGGWEDNNIYPRTVVDVNGDGLPDIVGFGSAGVWVSLNTGSGFEAPSLWLSEFGTATTANGRWTDNSSYPRFVVDMNGDGLPDIVGFGDQGVYVALNNGNKSFAPPSLWVSNFGRVAGGWTDNNIYPRTVADVNGDGLPDIVGFGSAGVWVSATATSDSVDVLTSLTNGLGIAINIAYSPLTNKTLYTKDNGSKLPVQDLQAPLYVVSAVSSGNGIGGTATTTYRYGGLKAEAGTGRGLLGFRWMQARQADTGITSYTEYRQDWPYVGMPALVRKTLAGAGNNGLLSQLSHSLACLNPADGGACVIGSGRRYFPYVSQSVETSWDLDGAALPAITTASQYDAWGNPTQITVTSSDGYSKTTTNSYTNDAATWFLGRLTRATVTSTTP